MNTFFLKLIVMPLIIALVTMASKKWGNMVGGVIAGMPWVGGAILLFIAIEQNKEFVVSAIPGVMVGLICWLGFCVSYVLVGQRFKAFPSMFISILVFLLIGLLLNGLTALLSPYVWFVVLIITVIFTLVSFPKVSQNDIEITKIIKFDIPLRMLMVTVFVIALTYAANFIGSTWSGILTPFPVITAVLAVFTHYGQGMKQVRLTFLGMFTGIFGFAFFLLSLQLILPHNSIAFSFTISLAINVAVALLAKYIFARVGVR